MPRLQCAKCPWRKSTDPHDIPNGYCAERHAALRDTIAPDPNTAAGLAAVLDRRLRIMACHETPVGAELPCVGWLVHQLGPGNNIPLRLAVGVGRISADVETVGPQHPNLEATLPKP